MRTEIDELTVYIDKKRLDVPDITKIAQVWLWRLIQEEIDLEIKQVLMDYDIPWGLHIPLSEVKNSTEKILNDFDLNNVFNHLVRESAKDFVNQTLIEREV